MSQIIILLIIFYSQEKRHLQTMLRIIFMLLMFGFYKIDVLSDQKDFNNNLELMFDLNWSLTLLSLCQTENVNSEW